MPSHAALRNARRAHVGKGDDASQEFELRVSGARLALGVQESVENALVTDVSGLARAAASGRRAQYPAPVGSAQ